LKLHPISCSKCGSKFDRRTRQERVCFDCKPAETRRKLIAQGVYTIAGKPVPMSQYQDAKVLGANGQVRGHARKLTPSAWKSEFRQLNLEAGREIDSAYVTANCRDRKHVSCTAGVPCSCRCHRDSYAALLASDGWPEVLTEITGRALVGADWSPEAHKARMRAEGRQR
jgi:hypothetical protein